MAHVSATVRPAIAADRPDVHRIAAVTRGEPDPALAVGADAVLDTALEDGRVIVAVEDGRVVGAAAVADHKGTPLLRALRVDPARRSLGIGGALVQGVVEALPAGTAVLLAQHAAADVDTARFLRRHGFARTHAEQTDDERLATVWRERTITAPAGHGHRQAQGHGHGHGHGDGHDDVDWAAMAEHLLGWDQLLTTTYSAMADWLAVRPGMRVLEIGPGGGGFAAVLAGRAAPGGHLTLADTDAHLLATARDRIPSVVDVTTVHADLDHHPWPESLAGPYDLIYASGVVHHLDDQLQTIRDLAQLLAPEGRLVVAEGGLVGRFLPSECGLGEPDLEARLHAATVEWFWREVRPAGPTVAVDVGWTVLLAEAGLTEVQSRSFLLDVPPPLNAEQRRLVASALAGTAERLGHLLAPDDRAAVAALVDPDRADGVHQRPDVFILDARTLHVAMRPA
jgi:SAM-dependent methyltransferase/GNAT superfamily N-acetyltransferase